MHTKSRSLVFSLVLILSALAWADFRTVGVYDPDDDPHHNQVDQSAVYDSHTDSAGPDNIIDLATFQAFIGRAFDADAGGIIDLEGPDDDLPSDDIVIAHFGASGAKSISFESTSGNLNFGHGDGSGNRLPLSGDGRFSKSGTGNFIFTVGEVIGGEPGEVITHFAGSLVERDNRDLMPMVTVTFSDGSTVTATADMAGDNNSPNNKDTFFGFKAPEGTSIVSVDYQLDQYSHLDDVAFITSSFISNPDLASSPSPMSGTTDRPSNLILSWTSALDIVQHDVYLSKDANSVTGANRTNPMDSWVSEAQDANTFSPAMALEFGQTYYWRVDEVHGATIDKGNVWEFTIEPYSRPIPGDLITVTADSNDAGQGPENTINGIGLEDDVHSQDVLEMWLSDHSEPNQAWIQYYFDKTYKLDQIMVWNHNGQSEAALGWGIKRALIEYSADGTQWVTLGEVELASATVAPFSEVDLQGIVARSVRITAQSNWGGLFDQYGLSEVRFLHIPMHARELSPAEASVDVDPNVALSWRAGRQAESHEVYVGSDPNDLSLAGTVTGSPYASYDTTALDLYLGQTYYWQINEVNEGEVPSIWEGDISTFSTRISRVVDDFESYTNTSPNRPFQTWLDGYGYSVDEFFPAGYGGNNTGSGVGHDIWTLDSPYYDGDIMEMDSVHGGEQSVPIYYGNGNKTLSEVDRLFDEPQDWTTNGIQELVVHYQGFPDPLTQDPNGALRLSACGDSMMANNVTADGCRFVYKTLSGDGSIIARLESHPHIHNWGRVGVMIRESLDPGSAGVSLYDAGANGLRIGSRVLASAAANHTGGSTMGDQQEPVWLKLERSGENINAFYTPDLATQNWIPVDGNPRTIPMGDSVRVGLALTSRYSTRPVTAVFTDVTTTAVGAWQVEDLGEPQPINTPAQLYVAVEDATGKRAVANHKDGINSVLQGQWTAWRVLLSDFTDVDLSQIKALTIGVSNTEGSGTGLVLIDDIELQSQVEKENE